MICYADASALVKRYVEEKGSRLVDDLFVEAEVAATSILSRAEVVAALRKAERVGALTAAQALSSRQGLSGEWQHWTRLPVAEPVIERATALAWIHGLRGYDAVHLAVASAWRDGLGESVTFATFDRRLWEAAVEERFPPFPLDLPELLDTWRAS